MTPLPWYCWRDGQTYGPFDDAALRSLAQQSRVRPSDVVSNGGAWVPAASVPGLFAPPASHARQAAPQMMAQMATPIAAVPVTPVAPPDAGLVRVPFALASPPAVAVSPQPMHGGPQQAYASHPGGMAAGPAAYAAPAPSYVPAFGPMTGSAAGMPSVAVSPGARAMRRERVASTFETARTRVAPWLLVGMLLLVLMWLWGVWNVPLATIQS